MCFSPGGGGMDRRVQKRRSLKERNVNEGLPVCTIRFDKKPKQRPEILNRGEGKGREGSPGGGGGVGLFGYGLLQDRAGGLVCMYVRYNWWESREGTLFFFSDSERRLGGNRRGLFVCVCMRMLVWRLWFAPFLVL